MPSAYYESVRQALRTTTGTQDFTFPGFGTPKGIVVFLTNATSANSLASNSRWSFGFSDLTNHRVVAQTALSGVSTSSNYRSAGSSHVALLIKTDGSGTDVAVSLSSTITDGVRLSVDSTNGTAYLITVILLGGTDVECKVGDHDFASVVGGSTFDVTGMSSRPDWGFVVNANTAFSSGVPTPQAGEMVALGMFSDSSGGIEQSRYTYGHGNGVTTTQPSINTPTSLGAVISNVITPGGGSASTTGGMKVNQTNSDGVQLGVPSTTDPPPVAFLLVHSGAVPDMAVLTSPTSVGGTATLSMTNPGYAFLLPLLVTGTGSKTDSTAGVFGFSFSGPSGSEGFFRHEADAVGTTDNGILVNNKAVQLPLENGSGDALVADASFSSTTFTLTFTTVQASARNMYLLLLPYTTFFGAGAGLLPNFTASGSGTSVVLISGSGAGTLPLATASGSGSLAISGSGAGSLPLPEATGSGSSTLTVSGSGAGSLPLLDASATGSLIVLGSGAGTLPLLTASGAGALLVSGSGAGTLPLLTASGVGLLSISGSGSGILPLPIASGSGSLAVSGSSAGVLPLLIGLGSGSLVILGSSSGVLPLPIASGSGTSIQGTSGSGAGNLPLLEAQGTGVVILSGSGSGNLPLLEGSGSGTSLLGISGSGSGNLPLLEGSGLGSLQVSGSGNPVLPLLEGSGQGEMLILGSGVGLLPLLTSQGSGSLSGGVGAGFLPLLTASGAGALSIIGSGAGLLPLLTALGSSPPGVGMACQASMEASYLPQSTLGGTYVMHKDVLGRVC